MKMCILIKEDVPLGLAMTAAAHASLAMWLKFGEYAPCEKWLVSFKKVICRVNEKEFDNAKIADDHVVLTESALDDQEVAIAFAPRHEWPKMFNFFRLYK